MSQPSKTDTRHVVAIYHQHLHGGGATQVVLHLIEGLRSAGYEIDLVVNENVGGYAARVPADVRIVPLRRSSQEWSRLYMLRAAGIDRDLWLRSMFVSRRELDKLLHLPSLTRYLRRRRPALVIANLWQLSIAALSARAIVDRDMRVLCIFHSSYFYQCAQRWAVAKRPRKWQRFLAYCSRVYARADALIAVSHGIADDLITTLGLPASSVLTIHNPVVATGVDNTHPSPPDHQWFKKANVPILIAIGRFSPEKNYVNLLHAFAVAQKHRNSRLVILGEGDGRTDLESCINKLGLSENVDLLGWVSDPTAFLSHANLFVLPSRFEGLPTGLIEALACGCPVVAYDCPHGPREVLDHGRYGALVPADDSQALATAINQALDAPIDSALLRRRAEDFSIDNGVSAYLQLVGKLLATAPIRS